MLAAALVVSCSKSTTLRPRESTVVRHLDQVVLLDVQGLFGGRDLWIASDGKAVCRVVEVGQPGRSEKRTSGLQEARYAFALSEDQRAALLRLVNTHRFFSVKTQDRFGVPDEARPTILITAGPKTHAVGKWANDRHQDFDPVYRLLRTIAESGKKGRVIGRGSLDWDWRPLGFPSNQSIRERTRPKAKGR